MGWLTLRLPIPISVNHIYTHSRTGVRLTAAAKEYRAEVAWEILAQTTPEQRAGLPEQLTLSLVYHPRERLDIDNGLKLLIDSMFDALDRNDRTIMHLQVDRSEAAERGVVGVQIGGGE